jgi:hypothetical protein
MHMRDNMQWLYAIIRSKCQKRRQFERVSICKQRRAALTDAAAFIKYNEQSKNSCLSLYTRVNWALIAALSRLFQADKSVSVREECAFVYIKATMRFGVRVKTGSQGCARNQFESWRIFTATEHQMQQQDNWVYFLYKRRGLESCRMSKR